MNILVVDDEEAQRSLIGNLLHLKGWTVYLAENGEEALNTMAKAKIDLIISDVYMPVMDGIKLYNIVREIPGYEQLPFLFVSAYDDEHTQSTVKDPKIEGFFKKGRPVAELEGWVYYLTAPEDQRPKLPPNRKPELYDEFRDKPGPPQL